MSDTSGPKFCEPFVHYDPDSSCWRTSEATFPWGSDEFSETWPKRGSMRNGVCYERQMSAPPTDVPECSSLLATPMAHERTFTPRAVHHGVQLANQVAALLPTPTASQPGGTAEQMLERKARMADGPRSTVTDLRMVLELLPTPTATDAKGSRNSTAARRPDSTGHLGDTLTDAAWKLPPTPTARDGKAGLDYRKRTEGDDLYQAASRIGSSTPAPSPDGNGSSDVPLPFR